MRFGGGRKLSALIEATASSFAIMVGALTVAALLVDPGGLAAGVGAAARRVGELFGRAPAKAAALQTKTTA